MSNKKNLWGADWQMGNSVDIYLVCGGIEYNGRRSPLVRGLS